MALPVVSERNSSSGIPPKHRVVRKLPRHVKTRGNMLLAIQLNSAQWLNGWAIPEDKRCLSPNGRVHPTLLVFSGLLLQILGSDQSEGLSHILPFFTVLVIVLPPLLIRTCIKRQASDANRSSIIAFQARRNICVKSLISGKIVIKFWRYVPADPIEKTTFTIENAIRRITSGLGYSP